MQVYIECIKIDNPPFRLWGHLTAWEKAEVLFLRKANSFPAYIQLPDTASHLDRSEVKKGPFLLDEIKPAFAKGSMRGITSPEQVRSLGDYNSVYFKPNRKQECSEMKGFV